MILVYEVSKSLDCLNNYEFLYINDSIELFADFCDDISLSTDMRSIQVKRLFKKTATLIHMQAETNIIF